MIDSLMNGCPAVSSRNFHDSDDHGDDGNDGRAPDFSAVRANARLELHEAICAERYTSILAALERAAITAAALHARLDTVSNRMWIAVTSVCGAAVVGLAVLVFYLLTKGSK